MITDEEVSRAVATALRRMDARPAGWREWLRENILSPITEWFMDLARGVFGRLPTGIVDALPWLALLAASVVVALAAVAVGRWLLRRESRSRGAIAAAARGVPAAYTTADDAEADAERFRAAGAFADAVRALYFATALRLHARRGLRWHASLTPGDVVRRFRGGETGPRLGAFVTAYQRVSFRGDPLDAPGYARIRELRPGEGAP